MNKQEFMKVQTCVLKVNIQCVCDGCEQKIRKSLQKIEGVSSVAINAEQGKVTVSGCFGDPAKLIKKLQKSGKHAELWGFQKGASNQKNNGGVNHQFKNIQVGDINKNNNLSKSHKGFGKDQKLSASFNEKDFLKGKKDQKSVKFDLDDHDDEDFDDEFDDEFDDDEDFDDEDEDYTDEEEEVGHKNGHGQFGQGHHLPNKGNMNMPKVMQGNGHGNVPYGQKSVSVMDTRGMFDKKGGLGGGGGFGGSVKKGGSVDFFPEGKGKGNKDGKKSDGKGKGDFGSEDGGKKNKNKNKSKKKDGAGGGGLLSMLGFGKKSGKSGSNQKGDEFKTASKKGQSKSNKSGHGHGHGKSEKSMKDDEFELDFPSGKGGKSGGGGGGKKGHMGEKGAGMNMGPMGHNMNMGPMGHQGNMGPMGRGAMGPMGSYMGGGGGMPAVQGLPAGAMMSGGYFPGMGPGNPYAHQQQQQQQHQQQQYMAMMMNQQRGNGGEMFQPMMYARPHPAVSYAPPHHAAGDNLTHFFSDENTESCTLM